MLAVETILFLFREGMTKDKSDLKQGSNLYLVLYCIYWTYILMFDVELTTTSLHVSKVFKVWISNVWMNINHSAIEKVYCNWPVPQYYTLLNCCKSMTNQYLFKHRVQHVTVRYSTYEVHTYIWQNLYLDVYFKCNEY